MATTEPRCGYQWETHWPDEEGHVCAFAPGNHTTHGCTCGATLVTDYKPDPVVGAIVDAFALGVQTGDDETERLRSELEVLRVENRLMRALLRDVELHGQAFEYRPPGRQPMLLDPADVTVHMRHDAVTAYEAALKVVEAAEAWRTATLATAAMDFADDLERAVDEWRERA